MLGSGENIDSAQGRRMEFKEVELEPYDPVNKRNLADGIVRRLNAHDAHVLPPNVRFLGAGVYLLYYVGKFKLYAGIAKRNSGKAVGIPIYVGKADPQGTRKGSGLDTTPGAALYGRLRNHSDRIRATTNLKVEDFRFRFVVLDHVWIRLGEAGLIDHYRPLWNSLLDGFGSKIPGIRRQSQQRSAWDTIHPGKGWPELLSAGKHQLESLSGEIKKFLT